MNWVRSDLKAMKGFKFILILICWFYEITIIPNLNLNLLTDMFQVWYSVEKIVRIIS